MEKLSILPKPLTREELDAAIARKKKLGEWQYFTWKCWETVLGTSREKIVVTKSMWLRTEIKYKNMKSVKEKKARKAAFAAATGAEKEDPRTSYVHVDGDPAYIVRNSTTKDKQYVQFLAANKHEIKWIVDPATGRLKSGFNRSQVTVEIFKGGKAVRGDTAEEALLIATVKALMPKKTKSSDDESFDTFVKPVDDILMVR